MTAAIRPALSSDIDALLAVENTVFDTDRLSRRSMRRLLESDTADMLVADTADTLAGYALVLYRRASGVARLYSLAVAPGHAGAGLGCELLRAAEEAAFANGRVVLRLEVREDNARAMRLYEAGGYRRLGRRENYYRDGAAALRYEKPLSGPQAAAAVQGGRATR